MKIEPEKKTYVIKAYVTKTYHDYLESECKRREIGISELIRISLYDYLNPQIIYTKQDSPKMKIDRTPRTKREDVRVALCNEFKKTDISKLLTPTPKDKIKHIYNIMV